VKRFLLQMHGTSGAGKSTLASAIGRETSAVVIDMDILKAGMLDDGVPEDVAGPTAYSIFFDLANSMLRQGFSVVMDSPANFSHIRERGASIAAANGAAYRMIECCIDDLDELQRRLDARFARVSQPKVAHIGADRRPGASPVTEPRLILDTSKPLEVTLPLALAYLRDGQS
jgi:predicted kinase